MERTNKSRDELIQILSEAREQLESVSQDQDFQAEQKYSQMDSDLHEAIFYTQEVTRMLKGEPPYLPKEEA